MDAPLHEEEEEEVYTYFTGLRMRLYTGLNSDLRTRFENFCVLIDHFSQAETKLLLCANATKLQNLISTSKSQNLRKQRFGDFKNC